MKHLYYSLVALASFIFIEYSCAKIDTTVLGSDLIPVVDNVNTFDTTLDVVTNNDFLSDTSSITYNEDNAVGIINDPSFGITKADIYSEIVSPSYGTLHPFTSKDSVKSIDSVVLMLTYKVAYGDTLSPLNLVVSEIDPNADFKDSVIGYRISSPDFPLTGPQLANTNVDLTRLNDSLTVIWKSDTAHLLNVMRIRLDNSIGQKLASFDTVAGAAYSNDSTFKTKFKGLAIKSGASGQALAYFNLLDPNSQLIVYYKAQKGGVADSAQRTIFTFAPYMHANLVKRTPAGAYASNMANSNLNDAALYIQSAPGSYASIKIPGLKGLNNRVVHRAELIVERDAGITSQNEIFVPPPLLFLDAIDSANSNRIATIPNYDFRTENDSYNILEFGGLLRSDDTYRFSLTRYVQGILTRGEPAYTLRLHAPYFIAPFYKDPSSGVIQYPISVSTKIAYGRVALKGGGYPDATKKMRLRIIYSKI
ncbi:MAG: DUF4270 family protein [Chitinophagaceae bacterium]